MSGSALSRFVSGGNNSLGWYDGYYHGVITESVAMTSTGTALVKTLPANAEVLASQMNFYTAQTLATAVRVGLGTTDVPDALLLSGTTVTAGTTTGPVYNRAPGLIFANRVASGAVSNTVTETAFTFTGQTAPSIAANALKPGDVIRIKFQGIATATNSTDTLAIKAYVGSVEVAAIAAVDVADNDIFEGYVDVHVRAVGSSGTCVALCPHPVTGAGKQDGSSTITWRSEFKASQSMDTTAAQTVAIKATWSNASSSNSCRLDVFQVEHQRVILPVSSSETTLYVSPVSATGIQAGTGTGTVHVEVHYRCVKPIWTT